MKRCLTLLLLCLLLLPASAMAEEPPKNQLSEAAKFISGADSLVASHDFTLRADLGDIEAQLTAGGEVEMLRKPLAMHRTYTLRYADVNEEAQQYFIPDEDGGHVNYTGRWYGDILHWGSRPATEAEIDILRMPWLVALIAESEDMAYRESDRQDNGATADIYAGTVSFAAWPDIAEALAGAFFPADASDSATQSDTGALSEAMLDALQSVPGEIWIDRAGSRPILLQLDFAALFDALYLRESGEDPEARETRIAEARLQMILQSVDSVDAIELPKDARNSGEAE